MLAYELADLLYRFRDESKTQGRLEVTVNSNKTEITAMYYCANCNQLHITTKSKIPYTGPSDLDETA